MPATTTRLAPPSGAGTVAASLAAVGSVLAATICCLPLFPFMMAAWSGRHLRISFGSSAVSIRRVDSFHRLRVLSIVAREKMPAPTEPHRLCTFMAVCWVRVHLDLFPADHGECDSWSWVHTVIL